MSYLQDKFVLDGSEKVIAMTYDNELADAAKEASRYLREFIPRGQAFFGIPVRWSMIVVYMSQLKEGETRWSGGASEGSIATIHITKSAQEFLESYLIRHVIGHEGAGHLIVDQDSKGRPIWYGESLAELGFHVGEGGDARVKRLLDNLEDSEVLTKVKKPLADYTSEDHLRGVALVEKGMYLLLRWRERFTLKMRMKVLSS